MSIDTEPKRLSVNETNQHERKSYRKSSKTEEELANRERKAAEKENLKKFKDILKKIYLKEFEHDDDNDVSLQPSYSKFQLP